MITEVRSKGRSNPRSMLRDDVEELGDDLRQLGYSCERSVVGLFCLKAARHLFGLDSHHQLD